MRFSFPVILLRPCAVHPSCSAPTPAPRPMLSPEVVEIHAPGGTISSVRSGVVAPASCHPPTRCPTHPSSFSRVHDTIVILKALPIRTWDPLFDLSFDLLQFQDPFPFLQGLIFLGSSGICCFSSCRSP